MTYNDSTEKQLRHLLDSFTPVSLEQLDNVTLQNRVDSKYVFHFSELESVLNQLQPSYSILEIMGKRIFDYETLYFDTQDFFLYRIHHSNRPNRMKVRYRKYVDSGQVYFEVKHKVKGTRTIKKRYPRDAFSEVLNGTELKHVQYPRLDNTLLEKKLWTRFRRITLSGKNSPERVTMDMNISFDNTRNEKYIPQLVIAEVKQHKGTVHSPVVQVFKRKFFAIAGFSKYCAGVALLEPIKHNTFKEKLIKINHIVNGNNGHIG